MTFSQDNRTLTSLSSDSRTSVESLNQASRTSTTLSANARTIAGSLTQDNRNAGVYLWTSTVFPWASTVQPWLISGGFQILNQDART